MPRIEFDKVDDGTSFTRNEFVDFVMKKMDLNDSGKINGDEIAALAAGLKGVTKDDLLDFDKNGDGKLSKKELKRALRETFDEADSNGNGKLSKNEAKDFFDFEAAQDAVDKIEDDEGDEIEDEDEMSQYDTENADSDTDDLPKLGDDADLRDAFGRFRDVDTNGDGEVTAKELARKAMKRYDDNDNGRLSEKEAKQMLKDLDIDPDRYDDIAGEDGRISKADLTKFLQNQVVDKLGEENDGDSLTRDEYNDM